ncbi:hypothetical protein HN011_008420 [Eciton burchellii]|nr:hypothetical protein HN011_008420 [Eciton burchellii]
MSDNDKRLKSQAEDEELNDLLDNALKDFEELSVSGVERNDVANTPQDSQERPDESAPTTFQTSEDNWTEDFLKQTAEQFEKNLQNLLQNGDSELEATLQKLGRESTTADETDETDNTSMDFQSTISRVLQELSTNSENLQNDVNLASMLGQTSLDDDTGNILPFMQEMMKQLLSKDILYTPVKELSDKYPAWLEEHKTTLSSLDLQRYTKQSELMKQVCIELEKEKEDDTEDVKKHRFESVLKLMTDMQNYGQAPEDLVGQQCTLFQFDSEKGPAFPLPGVNSQQECCIM